MEEEEEEEQRAADCREDRRKTQHLHSECWTWDVPPELTRLEDKVGSFIPTTPKRRGKRLHPEDEVCLLWLLHPSGFQCMDLSAHHPPPALLAAEGVASGL